MGTACGENRTGLGSLSNLCLVGHVYPGTLFGRILGSRMDVANSVRCLSQIDAKQASRLWCQPFRWGGLNACRLVCLGVWASKRLSVHERFTDGQSFAQKTNSTQWQMDDPPRIQKLLRWFGRTNTRMFWGSHQPDGSTFTSKQVPLFPQEKFFFPATILDDEAKSLKISPRNPTWSVPRRKNSLEVQPVADREKIHSDPTKSNRIPFG